MWSMHLSFTFTIQKCLKSPVRLVRSWKWFVFSFCLLIWKHLNILFKHMWSTKNAFHIYEAFNSNCEWYTVYRVHRYDEGRNGNWSFVKIRMKYQKEKNNNNSKEFCKMHRLIHVYVVRMYCVAYVCILYIAIGSNEITRIQIEWNASHSIIGCFMGIRIRRAEMIEI